MSVIGRHYGSVVRPDPPDYAKCRFASHNIDGDPIVGVFVTYWDTGDYGLRPEYDVVIEWSKGYAWGGDYNPNTGLWCAGEYGLSANRVWSKATRGGFLPLPGFEFRPDVKGPGRKAADSRQRTMGDFA